MKFLKQIWKKLNKILEVGRDPFGGGWEYVEERGIGPSNPRWLKIAWNAAKYRKGPPYGKKFIFKGKSFIYKIYCSHPTSPATYKVKIYRKLRERKSFK